MIQRIQSILLLLGAIAVFGLYKLPFGSVSPVIRSSALFSDGIFTIQDHVALIALFSIAGLLAFVAIFLFKNRQLQKVLSRVSIIANVIGIILALVLFMQDAANMGTAEPREEMGLGLPILSIIFTLFALRYINKDDKLVKSMDRLR